MENIETNYGEQIANKLVDIADMIRKWGNIEDKMTIDEMPNKIEDIKRGMMSSFVHSGNFTLAGNQSIAFYFSGTGFRISAHPANANLHYGVYKKDEYEEATYISANGNTMLYAKKKPKEDGYVYSNLIKSLYQNYSPDTEEQRSMIIKAGITGLEYGEYLAIITKRSGSEDMPIIGLEILPDDTEVADFEIIEQ